MRASTHCPYSFFMEIGTEPEPGGTMLHRESIQDDLGDLVDEVFVTAILADALPEDPVELHVEVAPVWREEPWAEAVLVTACPRGDGSPAFARRFETGRWMRRAQGIALRLESEEAIPKGATAYVYLLAERSATAVDTRLPALLPPFVEEQSLEDLGVMELGGGSLCPDRPILVNQRMVDEILDHTERAGSSETGGGTLGKMIRLPEPLPDTTTRVVTVLTASLTDDRHVGELARFTFDPEALHEAARIADLRGRGEAVVTGFHTHGWGSGCGRCNQNADCGLPQASHVSLADYQVLESLFPSKTTLMPIAGRKLGAPGDRPVLEIHAWRGGRMTPTPWRTYTD